MALEYMTLTEKDNKGGRAKLAKKMTEASKRGWELVGQDKTGRQAFSAGKAVAGAALTFGVGGLLAGFIGKNGRVTVTLQREAKERTANVGFGFQSERNMQLRDEIAANKAKIREAREQRKAERARRKGMSFMDRRREGWKQITALFKQQP